MGLSPLQLGVLRGWRFQRLCSWVLKQVLLHPLGASVLTQKANTLSVALPFCQRKKSAGEGVVRRSDAFPEHPGVSLAPEGR